MLYYLGVMQWIIKHLWVRVCSPKFFWINSHPFIQRVVLLQAVKCIWCRSGRCRCISMDRSRRVCVSCQTICRSCVISCNSFYSSTLIMRFQVMTESELRSYPLCITFLPSLLIITTWRSYHDVWLFHHCGIRSSGLHQSRCSSIQSCNVFGHEYPRVHLH